MMPRISIIIPCYNAVEFIEETIQSILGQNYPNFECIVMDGGSTDGTVEILKKYKDKIIWKSEKDRGQSDAINKGIKLASGDIVAYLNADDVYEKDCFQKVADFFVKKLDVKWVYGKCRIINEKGLEIRKAMTWLKNFWLKRYSYDTLLIMDFISQPAVFWRKELTDEIGFFEAEEHHVMDYEYWLRAGAKYEPGFIPEYLASFRVYHSAKTSLNPLRPWREGTNVAKRYTTSKKLIMLRYLVSLGIVFTTTFLNFISKIKGDW